MLTGQERWRTDLPGNFNLYGNSGIRHETFDGVTIILVEFGGWVRSVAIEDGTILWEDEVRDSGVNGTDYSVDGKLVLALDGPGGAFGLDPHTGDRVDLAISPGN